MYLDVHSKAILGRGQPGLMRLILSWIMPLVQDRSLDLLTSSPSRYYCTTGASVVMLGICVIVCNHMNNNKGAIDIRLLQNNNDKTTTIIMIIIYKNNIVLFLYSYTSNGKCFRLFNAYLYLSNHINACMFYFQYKKQSWARRSTINEYFSCYYVFFCGQRYIR